MNGGKDARLEALSQTAEELVTELNQLNQGTGREVSGLKIKVRRNQRVMAVVIASFLLDVVLTAVLAVTIHDVDKLTSRLEYSQKVQRARVLCPLYKIFVDSRNDQARATYPAGPAEYDRVFNIITDSYKTLNCVNVDQPIAPSRP
jgi:cell division protein FtsB